MHFFRSYPTLDSTNSEAQRILTTEKDGHGLVIFTPHQTQGRGQHGRSWIAQPHHHLSMTIILRPPHLTPEKLPQLSMKVSLALIRLLFSLHITDVSIKWPNDIYAGQKKLAGILIENTLTSSRVQHCLIGIGMNVNEDRFPEHIPNAVSLFQISNKRYDLESLARSAYAEIMNIFEEDDSSWKEEYHQHIFGMSATHTFDHGGMTMSAIVEGVNNEGKILLRDQSGQIGSYHSHEVKWRL